MIGFLGGTGPEGRGLALRMALAGESVMVGSRDASRSQEAAQRIKDRGSVENVSSGTNAETAERCDPVFLTVPYEAQRLLLESVESLLAGKVVVSTIAPVVFQGGSIVGFTPPEGSAASQAQTILTNSAVVAAFQTISASDLWSPGRQLQGDVVVCSDHQAAKEQVISLVPKVPALRAIDGGGLLNAHYVEEITALLLNINHIYRARASILITGLNIDK